MIHRRGLITGLISLVAAPAIVRAASLMPVKVLAPEVVTFPPLAYVRWESLVVWTGAKWESLSLAIAERAQKEDVTVKPQDLLLNRHDGSLENAR